VRTSSLIGHAINQRFHGFDRGVKTGVATPKTDSFIKLKVHSRYRDNIVRYLRVVQNIPIRESAAEQVARVQGLERQLLDPAAAAVAALQLEALGDHVADVLARGLQSTDEEVRFFAAEALAYLDDPRAARPLAEAARTESAFRWHALTALAAMDDPEAYNRLADLLHVPSAETRYGAFRALQAMNARDPLVRGESMAKRFNYHVIATSGESMVHVARSRRPEIVVFGNQLELRTPLLLFAGKELMIDGREGDTLKLTRFTPGRQDRPEHCSARLDDVIRAVVKLGGTYPDVVQVLQQAKRNEHLAARVVVDAIARPGRPYRRAERSGSPSDREAELLHVANPLPDLSSSRPGRTQRAVPSDAAELDDPKAPTSRRGFFGKIFRL
jgi:hypothetical protein